MTKNKLIGIGVVVVLLVVGGFFWFRQEGERATPGGEERGGSPAAGSPEFGSGRVTVEAPPPNTVVYTNVGYSPGTLKVKKGTTVTFQNESSFQMWPASARHPTHTIYPTKGGCIGSTLDACTGIPPRGSWTFKFDVVGTWTFHDHLSPAKTGTIVVE